MSKQKDKKKKQFQFIVSPVEPITLNQKKAFDIYNSTEKNLILQGVAGTGKTFVALSLALGDVLKTGSEYDQIIIIRNSVQSRDIGHLPGDAKEKISVFEEPYRNIVNDLAENDSAWDLLVSKKQINFTTTSFLRGVTFDNSIIIVDEIQNMSMAELDTIITRVGENCRIFFCGDHRQSDLLKENDRKGLFTFLKILDTMESFETIEFGIDDIVRSGLVREYLIAKEKCLNINS